MANAHEHEVQADAGLEPLGEPAAVDWSLHTVELQERLGYFFCDIDHLVRALTHRSFANENDTDIDNQRLEFLGDAVLDLVISTELYERYPELPEGRLSYLRSRLVREEALARQAEVLDLGRFLLLGRGEENSGGRSKPSLLADAYEAVLAAVYLDGGYDAVFDVIRARFEALLDTVSSGRSVGDHKTRLQELIQAERDERPRYLIVSTEGPPHARVYTASVNLGEKVLGTGTGCSKKAAQQDAARDALERLDGEGG